MLDGCQDVVAVVGIWSRERIIAARCGRQVGLRKELQDAGAELVLLESAAWLAVRAAARSAASGTRTTDGEKTNSR